MVCTRREGARQRGRGVCLVFDLSVLVGGLVSALRIHRRKKKSIYAGARSRAAEASQIPAAAMPPMVVAIQRALRTTRYAVLDFASRVHCYLVAIKKVLFSSQNRAKTSTASNPGVGGRYVSTFASTFRVYCSC